MKNGKIFVLITLLLFFYNLQAALVTHLKFENDFEDNYGDNNGSNMPASNDVSFTTGVEGKGIYFDGDDYLEIGKGDFDPRGAENSYSISLWVYESLGKSVNSISFVFRPKINGIPVFIEDISVEYDSQGLYQIRSRVPHSIALSRTGKIISEEKAVEELGKSVTIEEATEKKEMYVLSKKTNELVLASITKSEDMKTFIVVPLEEKNE
jgi:hypothetical protein